MVDRKPFSTQTLKRMSVGQKRRYAEGNYDKEQVKEFVKAGSDATRGKPKINQSNEKNAAWKGDNVGYVALHTWISRHYGKPMKCTACETTEYHRYEWANITGEYTRERWDWIRLCVPCHRQQATGRILIEVSDGQIFGGP